MFRAFILSVIIFWLSSCVPSQNTFIADIKAQTWNDKAQVSYANGDTMSLKDISLTVRYTSMLKDSLLGVEVKVEDPEGYYIIDSLMLETPATREHFAQSTMMYRTGNRFRSSGDYTFTISPLQRGVKGVTAVGITIH